LKRKQLNNKPWAGKLTTINHRIFYNLKSFKSISLSGVIIMANKLLKGTSILIMSTNFLFTSGCQKHYQCRVCPDSHKPPIANAGKDTTITLPVNSILLDGTASVDPDGSITSYHWKRLSGNASFLRIENENVSQTMATNLAEGEYIIALEVKDNSLLYASDIVVITVRR